MKQQVENGCPLIFRDVELDPEMDQRREKGMVGSVFACFQELGEDLCTSYDVVTSQDKFYQRDEDHNQSEASDSNKVWVNSHESLRLYESVAQISGEETEGRGRPTGAQKPFSTVETLNSAPYDIIYHQKWKNVTNNEVVCSFVSRSLFCCVLCLSRLSQLPTLPHYFRCGFVNDCMQKSRAPLPQHADKMSATLTTPLTQHNDIPSPWHNSWPKVHVESSAACN